MGKQAITRSVIDDWVHEMRSRSDDLNGLAEFVRRALFWGLW